MKLIVVELAHGLAQPESPEEGLGREDDRHEAQTEDDEIQEDQGHQDGIVLSWRRGEGGDEIAPQVMRSWGGIGGSYSCLSAQFHHSGVS